MSELETGTKPSKYTLATRETLIKIADDRDELKAKISKEVSDTGHRINTWDMNMEDIKQIQAENARLKKELAKKNR